MRTELRIIHYDAATGLPVFGMTINASDDPGLFGRWEVST